MLEPDMQVSKVKTVVDLADKHHLAELTVTEGDLTITVRRAGPPQVTQVVPVAGVHQVEEYEETELADIVEEIVAIDEDIHEIVAPLVGVFYRAPSPDSPNFVEVGDVVEIGQEVGLIEAMKVFSPVPSEVAGQIVEIPVNGGQLVHQGDVLVRIRLTT